MKKGRNLFAAQTSVGPLIQRNIDFLKRFNDQSNYGSGQRQMLEEATNEQLLCFVEICLNLLKGRLPVKRRSHLRKLDIMKYWLRGLARTRCARSARKILLTSPQLGSGFPAIAGLLTSILIPMLTERLIK